MEERLRACRRWGGLQKRVVVALAGMVFSSPFYRGAFALISGWAALGLFWDGQEGSKNL